MRAPFEVYTYLRTCGTQNLTLKALANFSPGLRFGNPGYATPPTFVATLKELRPLEATEVLSARSERAGSRLHFQLRTGLRSGKPWGEKASLKDLTLERWQRSW